MKKRILMLLANGFDPDPRVHNEARSLVKAGHRVTILAWDREAEHQKRQEIDGIVVERVQIRSSYGRGSSQIKYLCKFWRQAYQRAIALSTDVIHAHDFNTLPLGYLIGKKLKIPIVYDAHESYHEMLEENVHWLIKWTIAKIEKYLIKRIDLLITVGTLLEEEYKRRGARTTKVIGNWKRPEDYRFASAEIEALHKELGIPQDKLIISYIGYFEPSRGLIPLIEAVYSDMEVFLIIGGKGTLEREISAASDKAQNILYLGYVSPERIPILTATSDIIYYGLENGTGNNKYSTPNKLFEALAAGKAVITGDHGEISHIVKQSRCGIVLKHIDKKDLLTSFEKLRAQSRILRYKRNAAEAGKNIYNWQNAETALLASYNIAIIDRKCPKHNTSFHLI